MSWDIGLMFLRVAQSSETSNRSEECSDKVQVGEDVLQVGGTAEDYPLRFACWVAIHVNPES